MREISSLQHPLVKHLVKLREDRDYRYGAGRVVITGLKLIEELSSYFRFRTLVLEQGFTPSFPHNAEEIFYVTPEILKKISGVKSPEPIVAEIDMPQAQDLSSINFLLILDGISDPGNLGTLLRTALALGWEGVFLTDGSTDPFNEKALRAAKGATFKLPLKSGSLQELTAILHGRKFTLFAADAKGKDLAACKFSSPVALVLGNEAHGIAPELKKSAQMIAIPMSGPMESLNVASAGAILLYEIKGSSMSKDDHLWRLEEDFFSNDRKESRKERKIASKRDRSKYKKSDQDQLKKQTRHNEPENFDHLPRGRVLAILPEGIFVSSDGKEYICSLKGTLKQDKNRIKNLVAVGDFVRFEEKGTEQGSIAKVEERHSILSRADNLSRNKEQLIAVNIDQVLITASVVLPPLKPFLIDRYIIAAEKGNMEPIIVINKIDFLQSPPAEIDPVFLAEEQTLYDEFLKIYRSLKITVIPVSIVTGEGIDALKKAMHGKTSVFSGQSGVGKSSLINIVTGSNLATGSVVLSTRKGSHTTTTTHLIPLEEGGFCIDTPGIKSFGLWDLQADDIAAYFSEIQALSPKCKFPDCSHLNEPDCAVKKAVERKKFPP